MYSGLLLLVDSTGLIQRQRPSHTTEKKTECRMNRSTVVVEDGQGHLWVSTNKGLSRFDPRRETFRNYDVTDGLQSNEFNGGACLTTDGEEMFFGGIDGFNAFFPDHVKDNPTIPPVVLTSLTQGGVEVSCTSTADCVAEFTLNWPDNAFEFEFAALSFAHPEENQYAYYLEGFEETWNDVGHRRYGQYTNLPGGTYNLRVKGSNYDGVWNEVGTRVKITIVPPFWATWWFRGMLLLTLVGGAYGGSQLRVKNLEARSRELETQVVSRTRELAALNAVASVVSRSLDLHQVLTIALDKTLEVMEIEAGGIYHFQEDALTLTIAAHKGLSAQFVAEIDNLEVGEGLSGRVAQTGEPLIVQDLSTDPRLTRSEVKESDFHSLRSLLWFRGGRSWVLCSWSPVVAATSLSRTSSCLHLSVVRSAWPWKTLNSMSKLSRWL